MIIHDQRYDHLENFLLSSVPLQLCLRGVIKRERKYFLLWRKEEKKKIVLLSINTAVHTQFFFQFFLTLFSRRTNETFRALNFQVFFYCAANFLCIFLKNNQFDLSNCGIETSYKVKKKKENCEWKIFSHKRRNFLTFKGVYKSIEEMESI